ASVARSPYFPYTTLFRSGGVDVDERVEPFVHPRIQPLVTADNHRKPLVAELVRGHAEEPSRTAPAGAEHDHRILHPADGAVDVRSEEHTSELQSPDQLVC